MYIKCDATFHFACVEFILYRQTTEKPRNTLEANILPSLGIFFVILWVHEQASPLSFPPAFNPFIKANHNSKRKELEITKKYPRKAKKHPTGTMKSSYNAPNHVFWSRPACSKIHPPGNVMPFPAVCSFNVFNFVAQSFLSHLWAWIYPLHRGNESNLHYRKVVWKICIPVPAKVPMKWKCNERSFKELS